MIVTIHQPNYIPWLGYFHKIAGSDVFVSLDNVQFTKNSFQNRNRIKTAQGEMWLTVPVITKKRSKQLTQEVKINNAANWGQKHWRSIHQNYSKSLHFNLYSDFFENIYMNEKHTNLVHLNETILKFIIKALGLKTDFVKASSLGVHGQSTDLLVQICISVGADTYLSGPSGRRYLEKDSFTNHGLQLIYDNFQSSAYDQLFDSFLPGLSIIDLIFNCGPRSLDILLHR